jgi:excisionase family DNA binding protein
VFLFGIILLLFSERTTKALRTCEISYLTSAEAAEQLGVTQSTIQKWFRLGLLPGKRDEGQSLLWIQLNEELEYRLKGEAVPDPRMVTVRNLCRTQKMTPDQVLVWAQAQGYLIFRLQVGNTLRFYIMHGNSSDPL